MTESEAIKKAIRHFECMKNDAVVVLDSGFGTQQGESDLLYRNRKMYAEMAIKALEKQIPKKPRFYAHNYYCSVCDNLVGNNEFEWKRFKYCDVCGQKLDWSNEE